MARIKDRFHPVAAGRTTRRGPIGRIKCPSPICSASAGPRRGPAAVHVNTAAAPRGRRPVAAETGRDGVDTAIISLDLPRERPDSAGPSVRRATSCVRYKRRGLKLRLKIHTCNGWRGDDQNPEESPLFMSPHRFDSFRKSSRRIEREYERRDKVLVAREIKTPKVHIVPFYRIPISRRRGYEKVDTPLEGGEMERGWEVCEIKCRACETKFIPLARRNRVEEGAGVG